MALGCGRLRRATGNARRIDAPRDLASGKHQALRVAEAAERKSVRNRWYLTTPALIIITLAAVGPLFIMVVYSFLGKGDYGGVTSAFSIDAWFSVLLERDIFDDTLSFADAHMIIFWRSVRLAGLTTFLFGQAATLLDWGFGRGRTVPRSTALTGA